MVKGKASQSRPRDANPPYIDIEKAYESGVLAESLFEPCEDCNLHPNVKPIPQYEGKAPKMTRFDS